MNVKNVNNSNRNYFLNNYITLANCIAKYFFPLCALVPNVYVIIQQMRKPLFDTIFRDSHQVIEIKKPI